MFDENDKQAEVKFTFTGDSVFLIAGSYGRIYTKGDDKFEAAKTAILSDNVEDRQMVFKELLFGLEQSLEQIYEGFTVGDNDVIFVDGDELPRQLGVRLKAIADSGESYTHVLNFWKLLQRNSSYSSIQTCFGFMERSHLPFYNDGSGKIVAYKSVNSEFWDKYTGKTVQYNIGSTIEMDRGKVNDNTRLDCSTGFHVGSFGYASNHSRSAGDRLLEVLVDPADVVSVPYSYSGEQKMRVCKLVVLREIGHNDPQNTSQVWQENEADEDEDDKDACIYCGSRYCDDNECLDDNDDDDFESTDLEDDLW